MPRLKDFLPNMFGGGSKKETSKIINDSAAAGAGRLETDAMPVDDAESNNGSVRNRANGQHSGASTPTASAELTASVVRELSDPNYNSLEVAEIPTNGDSSDMALVTMADGTLVAPSPDANSATMNTMNVNNAQQQLVMQFSNVNKLHIGSVFNFNNNLTASGVANGGAGGSAPEEAACGAYADNIGTTIGVAAGTSKRQTRKTTSIVSMMQSQEEPNHRMLDTIATHLGEGWKEVMRKLGNSEGQIDQAVIDHQMHGGIREVIYQLLLQWVRNADDGFGTLGHITTLLWESNHRDCVQRMKLVWKAEVNRKTSR